MRKPRMKSMAFCRSCGVCLLTRLGGGRIRRLAKSVAKTKRTKRQTWKKETFHIGHTPYNKHWQDKTNFNIWCYVMTVMYQWGWLLGCCWASAWEVPSGRPLGNETHCGEPGATGRSAVNMNIHYKDTLLYVLYIKKWSSKTLPLRLQLH